MNISEPPQLTYFTQNEEELRERKKLAISEFLQPEQEKERGSIVIGS